jgi:hypothetical protein
VAAFDGRVLHVRSAGEDAWLCKAAPESVEHDVQQPADAARLAWAEEQAWTGGNSGDGGGGAPSDGALQVARANAHAAAARRSGALAAPKPLSFRSIADAVAASRDGDRIVLQLGQHNVGGEAVDVRTRVLIRGEGALGDTVLEQRANAPLFRLRAPAVVQNLVLDLCGFRECLSIDGDAALTPLIEGCNIRCSGAHAVVVAGAAAPTLRGCDVGARKAGFLLLGASQPALVDCTIRGCEQQGVRAAGASWARLQRCRIVDNGAEGVVAMDRAGITLQGCTLSGNKGPGVDASGAAHVAMTDCVAEHNAGGVFLWDDASADMQRCSIAGGPHHALLADARTRTRASACTITGDVMAMSDDAAAGVLGGGGDNTRLPAAAPATLPPEEGCFKFEADRFTRKQ